jgi:hypothetical protein
VALLGIKKKKKKKNGKTTRDVSWSITAGVPDHDLLDLKLSEETKKLFLSTTP